MSRGPARSAAPRTRRSRSRHQGTGDDPRGQTHWSQRAMAKAVGLSQPTIHHIWKSFGLQPHRTETFKPSPDPLFVEKVRDIAGLYLNPPDHAVVLCVDEKSQIQALNRMQPILPLRPGVPERQAHDYERNGTTILFAALNAHTGHVVGQCYRRHRSQEYLRFLRHLNEQIPEQGTDIHLIVDNYATHKTPAVTRWFARHPRFHVYFTPTYSSWMNLVEACSPNSQPEPSAVARFSVQALERTIRDYLDAREGQALRLDGYRRQHPRQGRRSFSTNPRIRTLEQPSVTQRSSLKKVRPHNDSR